MIRKGLYRSIIKDLRNLLIVNGILIRYLKWFSALDIKEEKTHPKLEVWAIKEFWITQKGKKLIDRVVLDF